MGIGFYVNVNITDFVCFKQKGIFSNLSSKHQELVNHFMYFKSKIWSTQSDANICIAKVWNPINRLSIIREADISAMFILRYGCTPWTQRKCPEKRLDGNHTRMLRAVLGKSWGQHLMRQQLNGHLPLISQTIQDKQNMLDSAGEAKTNS